MSPCAKMYKTLFLQQCKTYRPKKRQTTNYAPIMVCLQNYTPWAILSNIMCVCGYFMSISFFVAVLHLCLQSIYAFSPTYKILGHGVKDVLHHGQDGNLSSISYYFFITLFYSVACVSCSFCFFLWSFCNSFHFLFVSLLSFCCHFSFHFDFCLLLLCNAVHFLW